MSPPERSAPHTVVEVGGPGGKRYRCRGQDAGDQRMSLAAPVPPDAAGSPGVGERLTVLWAAGPHARYARTAGS